MFLDVIGEMSDQYHCEPECKKSLICGIDTSIYIHYARCDTSTRTSTRKKGRKIVCGKTGIKIENDNL